MLVVVANLSLWALFNRPQAESDWNKEIKGVSFNPYRADLSSAEYDDFQGRTFPCERRAIVDLLRPRFGFRIRSPRAARPEVRVP